MSKVCFNIKNVHYAVMGQSGYGTPVHIPGAVSLSVDPTGDDSTFYADGIEYWKSYNNSGYEGSLEMALIPDTFRQAVLGDTLDANNVLIEHSDAATVYFALGFQIDGDAESTYFWFYNCTASRPSAEANTTEESKEVDTQTLSWSCSPDASGIVRAKTTATTESTDISAWFTSVYQTP